MYHIPTPSELKRLRKEANLTQKELAKLANVSQPLIARIEKGPEEGIDPRVSTLKKILKALLEAKENKQKVIDFATKKVITLSEHEKISKAATIISEKGISQLIILDKDQKIIGSIREKSITRKLFEYGNTFLNEKIINNLDPTFPEISFETPLDEIKALLLENDALVLIDKGKLAGIVTKADIIKFYQL
ncbi:MAG: CBS domain-containing protein [Promethearchaeota archaeon]